MMVLCTVRAGKGGRQRRQAEEACRIQAEEAGRGGWQRRLAEQVQARQSFV